MQSIPSILPSLYDWGFWVPFFFRLFLAYHILLEARVLLGGTPSALIPLDHTTAPTTRKTLAWILMTIGILLLVGLGVQIVAVFLACAYLVLFVSSTKKPEGKKAVQHLLLLSALVAFSLLFLGPGPYAVDLPL